MNIVPVFATGPTGEFGGPDGLPWCCPEDIDFFRNTTHGQAILMGSTTRKTFKAPLPDRLNLVLTRKRLPFSNLAKDNDIYVHSLHEAVTVAEAAGHNTLFVIGGAEVLYTCLPYCHSMYRNVIMGVTGTVDTFFQAPEDWPVAQYHQYETFHSFIQTNPRPLKLVRL